MIDRPKIGNPYKQSGKLNKDKLKKNAQAMPALIQIGKNGITDGIVNHITALIKDKKLIKVKVLEAALASEEKRKSEIRKIAEDISAKTQSTIVRIVGNVITLFKR